MPNSKPTPPPTEGFDFSKDTKLLTIQIKDLEVSKIIKEYNQRYLYWDEVKRRPTPSSVDHLSLWKLLKLNRDLTAKPILVSNISGFKFKFNNTDFIAKQLHRFDLNLGGVLEGSTAIPEGQGDRYIINALMEEAIASSQLEGAATTRKVAKELLRSERKPKNHSEKMIVNNYLTIQEIKSKSQKELTPELILHFHKTITNQTLDLPSTEGRFRENNEIKVVDGITGEVYYTPPDYKLIQNAIKDICLFANSEKENDFIHPILRAITLHFLIGYLHPFVDGNGRTARALFYWYLLSKGYWLIEYVSISKNILKSPSQYARSYICTEDDDNDLTYFFHYNLKVLTNALKDFRRYITLQIEKKAALYDLNRIEDLNERQVEILFKINKEKHKIYTIKEIQNTFGIAYQTARTDLMNLVDQGYMAQKKSGNKMLFRKSNDFENIVESKLQNLL